MSKFILSKAMGNIPDDMLQEAMEVKKHTGRKWILRAAACAAVMAILLTALLWPSEENYITGPGLIKVYAHEIDEAGTEIIDSVALEEGVVFTPEYIYRTDTSYRENYPFLFQLEHELYSPDEIMLEVSTSAGIFYKHLPGDFTMVGKDPVEQLLYHNYGQHFTVSADEALYWKPDGFDYDYMKAQFEKGNKNVEQTYKSFGFSSNPAFFDVIIRVNDYIIGYCVIEVKMSPTEISEYVHLFSFEVVALVSFPMVDGKYQNVSPQYVQKQIQTIHSEREVHS